MGAPRGAPAPPAAEESRVAGRRRAASTLPAVAQQRAHGAHTPARKPVLAPTAESSVAVPPCARSVVHGPLLRRRSSLRVVSVRDIGERDVHEAGAVWDAGRPRGEAPGEAACHLRARRRVAEGPARARSSRPSDEGAAHAMREL